jgi:hypothetical protein
MSAARPRFSIYVHAYLWGSFVLFTLSPIAYVIAAARHYGQVPVSWWEAALAWPVLIAVLFWYALWRCSSDTMHFQDGLLWVTGSMMTGWMIQSFITVPAALLAAFSSSVLVAGLGEIRRRPEYAQTKWLHIVRFFHRNRMRR